MAIDWDAMVLGPVMGVFGEGDADMSANLPIYTPRGLPPFALQHAVFDAEYQHTIVGDDGVPITTHKPVLGVRTRLFPRPPAQNDQVAIPSTAGSYIVIDVQLDGHGHAKLILQGPIA